MLLRFLLLLLLAAPLARSGEINPAFFSGNWREMVRVKAAFQAGDPAAVKTVGDCQRKADEYLKNPQEKFETPASKSQLPPSKDKHDYMSLAIYWWPNPLTRIPYYRRDGEVNPEYREYDLPRLKSMGDGVQTLALAHFYTGNPLYAEAARKAFQAWFVDPATRMNPNLNFAQSVPGATTGSPGGLIETSGWSNQVGDALALLTASDALPAGERQAIQTWFRAFAEWVRQSKYGQAESRQASNHGSWYDVQAVRYAWITGDEKRARDILSHVGERRIAPQIDAEGRMAAEMKRTKSFEYTCYNLHPLLLLARFGRGYGIDLWSYQSPRGGSLKKAFLYAAAPFLKTDGPSPGQWPGQQIHPIHLKTLADLLKEAAEESGDKDLLAAADAIANVDLKEAKK